MSDECNSMKLLIAYMSRVFNDLDSLTRHEVDMKEVN